MVADQAGKATTIAEQARFIIADGQRVNLRPISAAGYASNELMTSLEELESRARFYEARKYKGIYYTLNPVKPDAIIDTKTDGAKDGDIVIRRWVLIDVDPKREPKDISSTDEERAAAWEMMQRILSLFRSSFHLDFRGILLADSGNGFHALIPIDLPNDEASRELIKSILNMLAEECANDDRCEVDTLVYNASRITKAYGTLTRKGKPTAERPHRYSKLLDLEGYPLIPWSQDNARHNNDELTKLHDKLTALTRPVQPAKNGKPKKKSEKVVKTKTDKVKRAKAWLAKRDPAISGQGGHSHTMGTVSYVTHKYDLSDDEAWDALQDWNKRCVEPWSEKDLRHKIGDATPIPPDKPRGWGLVDDDEDDDEDTTFIKPEGRTDIANGKRLVIRHGENIRWCGEWSCWLIWDGTRWKIDRTLQIDKLAKDIPDELWKALSKLKKKQQKKESAA